MTRPKISWETEPDGWKNTGKQTMASLRTHLQDESRGAGGQRTEVRTRRMKEMVAQLRLRAYSMSSK